MKIHALNTGGTMEPENVRRITIYSDGKTLYTVEASTFEEQRISDGKTSDVYDGRIQQIILSTEPKRARKENLSRKDNYMLSAPGRFTWQARETHLYIHASEIDVEPAGEFILFETNGETTFCPVYKLHFKNGASVTRCKIADVPDAGPGFVPPSGCKWAREYSLDPDHPNYDVIHDRAYEGIWSNPDGPKKVVKRWREPEAVYTVLVRGTCTRREKTPDRARREEIAETCNKNKVFFRDVSHYEIERLLQLYDLTPKKDGGKA